MHKFKRSIVIGAIIFTRIYAFDTLFNYRTYHPLFLYLQSDLLQQTEPDNGSANPEAAKLASSTTSATTTLTAVTQAVSSGGLPNGASLTVATSSPVSAAMAADPKNQPKRLHVSNIPFRFRDPDLRAMFGVSICRYLLFLQLSPNK